MSVYSKLKSKKTSTIYTTLTLLMGKAYAQMENPNQILELMKMKTPDMKKNMSKYSCFDKDHGHHTGAFYKLKEEIKKN